MELALLSESVWHSPAQGICWWAPCRLREEPVTHSLLSGSLILKYVHSFAGWRSAEIKIHQFARLKSSHLTQDSWKDIGMEMVVWHVGSEEHSWTVLHPGVCVVPGAILMLREWKIKTLGVLSLSKGTVRPQQALKLTANNWVTVVWEADSSPERF